MLKETQNRISLHFPSAKEPIQVQGGRNKFPQLRQEKININIGAYFSTKILQIEFKRHQSSGMLPAFQALRSAVKLLLIYKIDPQGTEKFKVLFGKGKIN